MSILGNKFIEEQNKLYEEQGASYYDTKVVNELPRYEDSEFDQPPVLQDPPPPAGASTYDALGRPYFGPGITGTLKRYAWQFLGSPTTGLGAENWKRILDLNSRKNSQVDTWMGKQGLTGEENKELNKRVGAGLFGAEVSGVGTPEAKKQEAKDLQTRIDEMAKARGYVAPWQLNSDPDIAALKRRQNELIGERVEANTAIEINGERISLLAPAVRAVQVGTSALLDLISEPAIKTEQGLGAQQAMRDFANPEDAQADLEAGVAAENAINDIEAQKQAIMEEKGLNSVTAAFDPDIQALTRQNYGNLIEWTKRSDLAEQISRFLFPVLQAYDSIRFFTAPGTAKEKIEAVKNGWNEGRLLYSEFASPAIEQEYKSRAAAGEDPQLLALELQNPWAELVGQLTLDPLNVLGYFSKASKIVGKVDEARTVVESSGLASQARFLNGLEDLGNAATDADAVRKIDNLAEMTGEFFYVGGEQRVLGKQRYTADALNYAGNRVHVAKQAGNVLTWTVGNLYKNGMAVDDVNDALSALFKLSDPDIAVRRQAIIALTHYPAPKTFFGQDFLETSMLLRNALGGDVNKLISKIDAAKGDWRKLEQTLMKVLDDAADFQYPSVSEMRKASEEVSKGSTSPRKVQLAEQFKELEKTRPGLVRMARLDEIASVPKEWINKILGKFYFSYNYGYATRNGLQNIAHVLVDAGSGAYIEDGKFLSIDQIDNNLKAWGQSEFVPAISPKKTLSKAMGAADESKFTGTAISDKLEVAASKRVYYKYFRQTMEQMIRPGVALPTIDEFRAFGFTDQQTNRFVALVKQNFGDVKKAAVEFSQTYKDGGPDAWRMWEQYIPDNLQDALRDNGILDEVMELAKNPNATREDITRTFEEMRKGVRNRAKQALNDLPGKNSDTPLTEQVAAFAERAKSNLSQTGKMKLDVLAESGYQAHDKYVQALYELSVRNPDDMELRTLIGELLRRAPDNEIRKVTDGVVSKTWEVQRRAENGENLQKLWDEITHGDVKFTGKTLKEFKNAIWEYKAEEVSKLWSQYFDRTFSLSEKYATKYGVTELLQEARLKVQDFRNYQTAEYDGMKIYKTETLADVAKEFGVKENAILNTMKKHDPELVARFTAEGREATPDELRAVLEKRTAELPQKSSRQQLPPPAVEGANPVSRVWSETGRGAMEAIDFVEKQMLDNWGMKISDSFTPQMAQKLKGATKGMIDNMAEANLIAQKVGSYWRDFALLPYGETTHMDHALSYIFPYQFWYSRSYANWAKRLASDPQIIAAYAKFKDQMAALHKDSPEWWKYNVALPEAMWGLNNGNPMYINLEASVWPLYGLTGTDFNDPQRRTNWFTSTIDDLGKFGPSLWTPINMAIATGYSLQGEQEAASRWAGRAVPQTATLKAIQAQLGMTPIELDPAVQAFDSQPGLNPYALDQYEEGRALRALAAMQAEGRITDEQAAEIAYRQEGPYWEEAIQRATKQRAPGQIASFFLGVGFKARTEQDQQMDKFYNDYFRLKEMRNSKLISPEQFAQGMNELRQAYPFMDTVLLGRRAGDDRDSAYAWNVIARIPPGDTKSKLYDIVGIDPETADKFYESGGDMTGWNEQERDEFMTAMINLGAMIAIPSNATRQSWTEVKNRYNQIPPLLKEQFGEDIQTKIDDYFSFEDKGEANLYMEAHPEVGLALDMQNQIIANDPMLAQYYGGIDALDRYYTGLMYDQLEKDFGEDVVNAARQYSATFDEDEKKLILQENPKLKEYWKERARLSDDVLRKITDLGALLPEPEISTYGEPQNPTQEQIQDFANPQPSLTAEQWQGVLGDATMSLIADYAQGEDLTYSAERKLDYIAERMGLSREELIQQVLISMQ